MQRYLLFSLMLWLPGLLFAAEPLSLSRDELVKRLSYYQSIKSLQAKFHETKTLKDMKLKIESDGELTVIRPSKVIWKVLRPSVLTVILDEGQLRIEDKDGKGEKYNLEGNAKESMKALVAWLKLDPDDLLQSYKITALGQEIYRFEPKAMDQSPMVALEMHIKAGSYVEKLKIDEKSGDTLEIRFEKPRLERLHAK